MAVVEIPTTDTISVTQLTHLREKDPLIRILDVRTGGEFENAHIPGSRNVPLDSLDAHLGAFASIEAPIVLVCQSGGRASQAQKRLAAAGQAARPVLDGGLNAWTAANGDLDYAAKQRWALDRQVRLVAGAVAVGGVVASAVVPKAKWMSAAVGTGLLYMAATNTCPVSPYVAKLPYNRTPPCDVDGVLQAFRARS